MMRYFLVVLTFMMLFLSGCKVDFVSRVDNNKVYVSGSGCAEKWQDAKAAAIEDITQHYPLIEDALKGYIATQKVDGNGTVCYEAVITAKQWGHYVSALEDERKEIIRHSKEYVQIFEYKDKDVLINTLLTERQRFNEKLKVSKSIAPVNIEPFKEDYKSLENSINVLPTIAIRIQECNHNKNLDCDVGFKAVVKDESQELAYLWDFGDGQKSEEKQTRHRYAKEGSYSATLQVTDPSGLSTFMIRNVEVAKGAREKKKVSKNSLNAYFILKKKYYKVGEKVYFDNRSKAKGSKITHYKWEFGDGSKSTLRNPAHRYKRAGRYVVKYEVCNANNACAYASTRVKIVDASKYAKAPQKKKQKNVAVKPVKKVLKTDAKKGEKIAAYIARKGQPDQQIVKKKSSMTAYRYGDVWILAKRGKIECAVTKEGFATSLMGQPKKCNWHEKNAKKQMVQLSK